MAKYIITEQQRSSVGIRYTGGAMLSEEIKPLSRTKKNELIGAGYDANLSVDLDGYTFVLDLLSGRAVKLFNDMGFRGALTLTNRDLSPDKLMSAIKDLKVNKSRATAAPTITGVNAKRPVVLPAGGKDLQKKLAVKKHQNRIQKFDVANADVKIDTRTYEDGSSTYIISPLSQVWKDKLGSKKFAATQDSIRDLLKRFDVEGAKVLAEGVMDTNTSTHKVCLLDNDVLALTFLSEDINGLEPYYEKDIDGYNNSAGGWHDNTNVENAITALLKNRNISISEGTLKVIAELVFDYFR